MISPTITTGKVALRPYQKEAAHTVLTAPQRGIRRPLVALPTGCGKTHVFTHVLQERGGRSLILVHRDELLQQAISKLLLSDPFADVGVVKAGRDEVSADTVVASVQTLARANRLTRLTPDFTTIVVDEAHHVAEGNTYFRILRHLRAFEDGGPLTLGVTATPFRADGADLGAVFDKIVYQRSLLEMIRAGYLSDLHAVQVQLKVDFSTARMQGGDFVERDLGALLTAADAPSHVLAAYQHHGAGRKALIFTPTVETAHTMAATFADASIAAEALDGETPADERRAILHRFHTGDTKVLSNCSVLTEGFDEPSIDCVIVARPTTSKGLYVQMVGRGTRRHPGKQDCLIIDVTGASTRHDLLTTESLFELAPGDLDGRTVGEAVYDHQHEEAEPQGELEGELVWIEVDLFARRDVRWVQTVGGAWVLPVDVGKVRLRLDGAETWIVELVRRGQPVEVLGTGLPVDYAQGVGEDAVRKLGSHGLVDQDAAWRAMPASGPQLETLRKLRIAIRLRMTRGEANDAITRVAGDWN